MTALPFPQPAPRYVDAAEVAKWLRKDLKASFPACRFSVRLSRYAGGSSIDITWTDGPTEGLVKPIANHYTGADFDGMIDLQTPRGAVWHDGELVKMGGSFIFTKRQKSAAFLGRIVAAVAAYYGTPPALIPAVLESDGWGARIDSQGHDGPQPDYPSHHGCWESVCYRAGEDRSSVTPREV